MKEHETHEPGDSSEEGSDLAENPDQQQREQDRTCQTRNEKLRMIVVGLGLLALLAGFLCYLWTRNVLPLFGTIVVVFLGYRRIDAWLDSPDRS